MLSEYDKSITGEPELVAVKSDYIPGVSIRILDSINPHPELVFTLLDNMLSALHFLHLRGIVHTNINDNNIIYDDNSNEFILIDFSNSYYYGDKKISDNDFKKLLERDLYKLGIAAYKLGTGIEFPYRNTQPLKEKYLIYKPNRDLGYFIDILILENNRSIEEIYKMWVFKKGSLDVS